MTQRDLAIMSWVNEFYLVTADQIMRKFEIKNKQVVYRVLNRLVENEFMMHDRIFHGQAGVYYLTYKGAQACRSDLSPVRDARSRLATYEHDLAVVECYLFLMQEGEVWKSERRLRHEWGYKPVGQEGHIPDGIYESDAFGVVAIEFESTVKAAPRLKKIIDFYDAKKADLFDKVWYITSERQVVNALKKPISKSWYSNENYFEIYSWPGLVQVGLEEIDSSDKVNRRDGDYEIWDRLDRYMGKRNCEKFIFEKYTSAEDLIRCKCCDLPLVKGSELVWTNNTGWVCVNRKCELFV